jgi:antitoxin FitA
MSQVLTIRNIEPEVKERLRIQAAKNGRSMEAEVRMLLQREFLSPAANDRAAAHPTAPRVGFGTQLAALFAGIPDNDMPLETRAGFGAPRAASFE